MKNEKIPKKLTIAIWAELVLVLSIIGASYAYFSANPSNKTSQTIIKSETNFTLAFQDGPEINVSKLFPGESLTKTFSVSNDNDRSGIYNIDFSSITNTLATPTDFTYILISSDGGKNIPATTFPITDTTIATEIGIEPHSTHTYKLIINFKETNTNQNENQAKKLSFKIQITETGSPVLLRSKLINDNGGSNITTLDNSKYITGAIANEYLLSSNDNYGITYYFRGNAQNNLIFGGFCWQVIRINGDGTMRLIYNGTPNGDSCANTNPSIGTAKFNNEANDNAYVGYMYGQTNSGNQLLTQTNVHDSNIKTMLDNWYQTNLNTVSNNIVNGIYCNDRFVDQNLIPESYTKLGYNQNNVVYGIYNRLYNLDGTISSSPNPSLICSTTTNSFTINDNTDNKGNNALINPIGLITADEVIMAGYGLNTGINTSYYLYTNTSFWTMTPASYTNQAEVYSINSNGSLVKTATNSELNVRPVINIKKDIYLNSGEGSKTNPYKI